MAHYDPFGRSTQGGTCQVNCFQKWIKWNCGCIDLVSAVEYGLRESSLVGSRQVLSLLLPSLSVFIISWISFGLCRSVVAVAVVAVDSESLSMMYTISCFFASFEPDNGLLREHLWSFRKGWITDDNSARCYIHTLWVQHGVSRRHWGLFGKQ